MTTETTVPMVALETVLGQDYKIVRGDLYPPDHEHVKKHGRYFARADTPGPELRQRQADIIFDSVKDAYQHPPAPAPVKMRAHKAFTAEIITSTQRDIREGEEFMSNDDIFLDNARMFEPASKPRRGKAKP